MAEDKDRPDGIPQWALEEVLTVYERHRVSSPLAAAHDLARAIFKAREEAFEEAAQIANQAIYAPVSKGQTIISEADAAYFMAAQILNAIRQPSQKGER